MAVRDQGAARVVRDGAAAGVHWAFLNPVEDDLDAIRREFPAVCLSVLCPDEIAAGRVQGQQMRTLVPLRPARALHAGQHRAASPRGCAALACSRRPPAAAST